MSENRNVTVIDQFPLPDVERMADYVAKSGLFGIKTKEQAVALMMLAQAEGTHPMIAARDYDIIQGRPSKKAEAMLRDFQKAGGSVEWHALSDTEAKATFSHPRGGTATIDWDMKRANAAQLGGKDMWKKFPRQMLRSRVVSEGCKTIWPSATSGMYTPEETSDFEQTPMRDVTPPSNANTALSNFVQSTPAAEPQPQRQRPTISMTDEDGVITAYTNAAEWISALDDRIEASGVPLELFEHNRVTFEKIKAAAIARDDAIVGDACTDILMKLAAISAHHVPAAVDDSTQDHETPKQTTKRGAI